MSQAETVSDYVAVIKGHNLAGMDAVFTYVGSLEDVETPDPKFKVILSFKEGDSSFSVEHTMFVGNQEMYDTLDLSLCLHAIADRDHTVERLADIERSSGYGHTVESVMFQELHEPCFVELLAKRTRRSMGVRILWFFFRLDEHGSLKLFELLATPEEIRKFARSLRDIFERLSEIDIFTDDDGED